MSFENLCLLAVCGLVFALSFFRLFQVSKIPAFGFLGILSFAGFTIVADNISCLVMALG